MNDYRMSPRERVLKGLNHEPTDRIPMSLGFGVNKPAKIELMKHLNYSTLDQVDEFLLSHSDFRWVEPDYTGPADRNIKNADGSYTDIWGVRRKMVSYGPGEYDEIDYYPLSQCFDIRDLDSYLRPSADWFDYSSLKQKIRKAKKHDDYAIIVGSGNIFESSWYMRGLENMLMDLITDPDLASEIMTRVTDFFIEYFSRCLEAAEGEIDIVFTADDLGQQNGLIMSPRHWEELIKPHHKRMNDVLHSFGVKIMYHTDGAVMEVIEGLMDMGIDILEALQFDAEGMDPVLMKKLYGHNLCFHGGVSVQSTLPYGTVDDVKNEVLSRIEVLGDQGGYILAPSHAIQAGTPVENILAFLETPNKNTAKGTINNEK
ncbi:MAG: uroporphyrinogen decarboxylase family protein [Spirochaetales bacterium]|nr:uroporphyrinogen decarboxylase family protein [Spirochaetales bacterium]